MAYAIPKGKFISAIERLDEVYQNILEIEYSCHLKISDSSSFWKLTYEVIDLLSVTRDDRDLIDWFCWEKDFGRNEELGAIYVDGVEYPANTAEDLYNVLQLVKGEDNV